MESFLEMLTDLVIDTAKALPILFCCYFLLEFLSSRNKEITLSSATVNRFGPLIGSAAGLIPQCGFSAAATELYNKNAIKAGTLIAVFVATSDEALPILLADLSKVAYILPLLLIKFAAGFILGYLFNATVFRKETAENYDTVTVDTSSCEKEEHHHHDHKIFELLKHSLYHTVKITAYLLVTMFVINTVILAIGEENLASVLLKGSIFTPFITAALGLIPGCSMSVLLTELFLKGSITFGSAVAGLSVGAGFGYVILFKNKNTKKAFLIVALTYISGALIGILINLF